MPFDISNEVANEKDKKKVVVNHNVKFSFMLTYILLLTTATITFIEAIRTTDPIVRHIFNLETTISIVAGYFYSVFVAKIDEAEKQNKPLDWLELTKTRYSDWVITTPMMLLALVVVLGYNSKITVKFMTMISIVLLNYVMLYIGYLGETNVLKRFYAMIIGFVAFFAMFFIIFMNFVRPKYNFVNNVLFGFYLIVWSLYGIVYMFGEETKNIVMNALDCTAKCLIGLFLWVYYTGIVKW
uniref:Bacteriorhodopsin-like protein n=1 Tax=viral metagenome TaxID=1070528 RepID=A0A6C0KIM8_9ZZZZ